jgi:hypothetical protein
MLSPKFSSAHQSCSKSRNGNPIGIWAKRILFVGVFTSALILCACGTTITSSSESDPSTTNAATKVALSTSLDAEIFDLQPKASDPATVLIGDQTEASRESQEKLQQLQDQIRAEVGR